MDALHLVHAKRIEVASSGVAKKRSSQTMAISLNHPLSVLSQKMKMDEKVICKFLELKPNLEVS